MKLLVLNADPGLKMPRPWDGPRSSGRTWDVTRMGLNEGLGALQKRTFQAIVLGLSGFRAVHIQRLRRIRRSAPDSRLVVLYRTPPALDQLYSVMRIGVQGLLPVGMERRALLRAVEVAGTDGLTAVDPGALYELLERCPAARPVKTVQELTRRGLTEREAEVLIHVGEGCSNQDIASSLEISIKTVKNHLHSIYKKLGVKNRTQAAMTAINRI